MRKKRDGGGAGAILLLVIGALFVVAVSPGLLLGYGVTQLFELALDRGQIWTLACMASIELFALIALARGSGGLALWPYVWLCVIGTATLAIAHHGLKAEWPAALWGVYFG